MPYVMKMLKLYDWLIRRQKGFQERPRSFADVMDTFVDVAFLWIDRHIEDDIRTVYGRRTLHGHHCFRERLG
eukprot:scaffold77056_cov71-Attheya_sp.AAC.2